MAIKVVEGDIVEFNVDAVVNAANIKLRKGGGVCGAIFKAAGSRELKKACSEIRSCEIGKAVITSGFDLQAKFIIHTVGPIYNPELEKEQEIQLYNCYKESLFLAKKNNIRTIAFPLLSSGIYGYPREKAMRVAKKAINDFLEENDMEVYLVLYQKRNLITKLRGAFKKC